MTRDFASVSHYASLNARHGIKVYGEPNNYILGRTFHRYDIDKTFNIWISTFCGWHFNTVVTLSEHFYF